MISWKEQDGHPVDLRIDGQLIDYYHTEEGRLARIKACTIAMEDRGCWPPCGRECCRRVREFITTPEYTGNRD